MVDPPDPAGSSEDRVNQHSVPEEIGPDWVKVQDESSDGFRQVVYRDKGGHGPRRVVIVEDRDGGYHVDQKNENWPNHANWLTDEAARDEDRAREPVPFDEALDVATEYIEGEPDASSVPYDPTFEFDDYGPTMDDSIPAEDRTGHEPIPEVLSEGWVGWTSETRPYDPTLEEELEFAGIDVDDLVPTDDEPEEIEPPETVAGWELLADEGDFYSWKGSGGSPPAGFIREETTATVSALSHGGRWEHRWSVKVRYEGPGNDGEEHSTTSTIASHKLTLSGGDKGYAKNRAKAIRSAVDWMEGHPSQQMDTKQGGEEAERETIEIEFGSRELANAAREWLPEEARTGKYDGRHKTVEVYADELTDFEQTRLRGEAADSKAERAEQYGQSPLTDAELDRLRDRSEWSPQKRFHAQAAKAVLRGKGVEDWTSYYDLTLTVDEHRGVAETAVQDERGQRLDVNEGEEYEDARFASGYHAVLSSGCDHARDWCEQGQEDACEYLIEVCDWTADEVDELARQVEAFETEMDELGTDDGGRVGPEDEVDAPAVPATGEIPGFAKGTLKRAWTGYSVAVREAAGYLEAAEEFEAHRAEAERYAQIVNEVRGRFGQEPMSFDRLGELNEVAQVELPDAPTNESNTTGFRAALEWSQRTLVAAVEDDPYDPTQEVGEEAGSSELKMALQLHSTRSEKAQDMDESIQARDQVTDFETWAEAPNMMDFVGVDDLESILGHSE